MWLGHVFVEGAGVLWLCQPQITVTATPISMSMRACQVGLCLSPVGDAYGLLPLQHGTQKNNNWDWGTASTPHQTPLRALHCNLHPNPGARQKHSQDCFMYWDPYLFTWAMGILLWGAELYTCIHISTVRHTLPVHQCCYPHQDKQPQCVSLHTF